MYEELYERLRDVSGYLRRIGLEGQRFDISRESLDRLIRAHITHVPFENIDVWDTGACPDIGTPAVYDKVIVRHRGGYCFEINGLFGALLRELGFEVYNIAVRIMVGRNYTPPCTHRANVVVIDGQKYFCDIGFGTAAIRGGVPFNGPATHDGYRAVCEGHICRIYHRGADKEELIMSFTDLPFEAADYIPINFYDSQVPDYPFRVNLSVSIATENGRKQLFNYKLKEFEGETLVRESEAANDEELCALLEEHFGIVYRFQHTRP